MAEKVVFGLCRLSGVFPYSVGEAEGGRVARKSWGGLLFGLFGVSVLGYKLVRPYPVSVYQGEGGALWIIRILSDFTMCLPLLKTLIQVKTPSMRKMKHSNTIIGEIHLVVLPNKNTRVIRNNLYIDGVKKH
jgi:hypothetical protein